MAVDVFPKLGTSPKSLGNPSDPPDPFTPSDPALVGTGFETKDGGGAAPASPGEKAPLACAAAIFTPAGSDPAGNAKPGEISIPATCAVADSAAEGAFGTAVPPAIEAIASGFAVWLGGTG